MDQPAYKTDTQLIDGLKAADKNAADELISRYFPQVFRAAEQRLNGRRVHATGPDDVTASVFESLWRRASENRFTDQQLNSREELWRLLSTMLSFKVTDHLRRETALKRGGGVLKGESAIGKPNGNNSRRMEELRQPQISAHEMLVFEEELRRLLELLGDDVLREVALMRLDGSQVQEIAEAFQRSSRWVKRKLAIVRGIWKRENEEPPESIIADSR